MWISLQLVEFPRNCFVDRLQVAIESRAHFSTPARLVEFNSLIPVVDHLLSLPADITGQEAMRILAALNARPRRTIRVALWSGEEQGLLGARAYINQHLSDPAARDKVSAYLNDDPGSGETLGFYMQGNAAAKAIFDAWLEPLRDLGVTRNIPEGIGSTDHVAFDQAGIPAFNAIKDFAAYDERTRHTNADFPERMTEDALKQQAIVMASFAWHAAMRDERIPRAVVPE